MEFSYKVTVFTPTYNRAYILENLYRSLQRQSCTDFEWLIVDDGSSDDTQALVESWQAEENPFPIRYVYQENGGKCRAINRGLELLLATWEQRRESHLINRCPATTLMGPPSTATARWKGSAPLPFTQRSTGNTNTRTALARNL